MGNKGSGQVRTTPSSGGSRKTYIIVGAVVLAFVAGFVALVVLDSRQQAASTPPGEVRTYDVGQVGQHTDGDVDYEQTPPAGGEHDDVWQNSGFYEQPIRDENAVHTLEHGAVWITYDPDLPQDQKNRIRGLVEGQTCMLASPHPDLPNPVVASAWGKQLTLESADSADLERFVRAYRQGPQTPEPGAACTGGTSDTV
ncbi:MAG: putative membrane protein [uncultured Rubrobacteraceae bacterium]|uniref:Putative membrane protein n=1 Tax=uncultured Rubrobacteraceae bacterium TaxID=349277 RepID=A0A6J4Q8X3_9ACTN|nr:MAG: putative membrane protein [uncultured Rubrobacteraceae bacterium]